ncbi:hypothetical protein NF212_04420 [Parasalinivibrio latis]|uniref:hypothetical protein n=1 Tax=Parasalinivibrio latis TaxID=2952610 RepID=UPI0030E07C57
MLRLVVNNTLCDKNKISDFVEIKAPELAQHAIFFLDGGSWDNLKKICATQLMGWWRLEPVDSTEPANDYESAYWHLLFAIERHSLETILASRFFQHQIREVSEYLLGDGALPQFVHGIRP